MTAYKNVITI